MRKLVLAFVLFFLIAGVGQAQEEWTQEKFTDLVTFAYTHGEVINYIGVAMYNLTLKEEGGWLTSYFVLIPDLEQVILTVEASEPTSDGSIVYDHNWYEHWFCEKVGEYYPFPNVITGRFATLKDGILLESVPKTTQTFKEEGYRNKEWRYWIDRFYNYMQETLAKGVAL